MPEGRIPVARPWTGEEEAQAVRRAILSGWVTQGAEVAAFEREFATNVGAAHARAPSPVAPQFCKSEVTDEVFNVEAGIQTSLNELCELLLRLTGSSLRPEYRDARKIANVQSRRAAVEKAEQKLGFKAKVCLEEGLRELIRWRELVKLILVAESA